MAEKFRKAGGFLKDFCKAIGKCYDTIDDWRWAYEKHGMAGLVDKKTRPKHFPCKISKWVKEQLLALFLRFPEWTPYQCYRYLKDNPAIHALVSIPTIKKMKDIHTAKSKAEKERIKKRWAFAENCDVWTVDFVIILETPAFCLQLLTVSDQRSRYIFEPGLFLETSTEKVMDHLEELFIKYGKPFLIKADNGPEFRLDFRDKLQDLCVYLLNSPKYYPRFDGAHERLHRSLWVYIEDFRTRGDIIKLVEDIKRFCDEHNHHMTFEYLENKSPATIFYSDEDFIPKDVEIVRPYFKDGELRMKFTNRAGNPARIGLPELKQA